jgi:Predicted integral membrane protein (DUF2269)
MFSFYLLLKFIHIASAIVAIGANITYGVWNVRGAADPAHLGFALKGVKFLDDRIANPAYGVLFLTGLAMVFLGHWGFALWVVVAIVLFIVVAVLGFAVFTPQLSNQIKLVEAGDTTSPAFVRGSNMSRILGPILGLIVLVILALMVFKPTL